MGLSGFIFISTLLKAEVVSEFSNRLAREKSPYLLQHAHNPVDWYPWGDEAFQKAKKEDKPVLLSVGYSTCHWCHVMEEESFSHPETAKIMNENFVSIKVDREERPDIDSVYMSYVMAATGSGGWPMNVFLTPDKKPFYGGTYFPPDDRYGIPSFGHLLQSIAHSWKTEKDKILESADSAVNFLAKSGTEKIQSTSLSEKTLNEAYRRLEANFDEKWGGFGRAPKFPRSHALSMILRVWARTKEVHALEIVEKTLKQMAQGGMYDQLGGGFHRYSTDGQWRVPHFEKMLYDQAILARTYLEAYQITQDDFYARIAREILDYVASRMTAQEGGFYSAEDADSPDPENPSKKREGAYFVWKKDEIEKIQPSEDVEIFSYYYGVEASGNALHDPHKEFVNQNVLYVAHSVEETAVHFKKSVEQTLSSLSASKKKMLEARAKRPAPYLDDKVLTDWNGLMISSFAFASRVLEEPRYADIAEKAGKFIQEKLKDKNRNLLHRYRDGEAGIEANFNDHAFFIYGALALYEATFDPEWLGEAKRLSDQMIEKFWDKSGGGFFLTAEGSERLIARPKEIYDGAIPSGNSVAALDLLLLSRFTGDTKYESYAQKTLDAFSAVLSQDPANYPQMLMALDFSIGPSQEIVLAGDVKRPETQAMLHEIFSHYLPNKIVMLNEVGLEALSPFVKDKNPVSGKSTVYVCRDHTCQLPVTDVEAFKKLLNGNSKN